jgi:L-ascorbate metabolism protein UlaG (beta-lactamase superfamily)
VEVTYYGHACVGVTLGGARLLFDPFITPNEKASAVVLDDVPADFVLVSHGHEDHVADVGAIIARTGATLISNYEIVTWFQAREGVASAHPLNHGGGAEFSFGRAQFVQAVHSSVLPDGTYGGNPGEFVVSGPEGRFYFSGDTALTYDMKLIGAGSSVDWAALCIGDNFTMGVEDAVKAAGFVGVSRVLGIHYDTFPPITIDHDAAREAFARAGVELLLPGVGETVQL